MVVKTEKKSFVDTEVVAIITTRS